MNIKKLELQIPTKEVMIGTEKVLVKQYLPTQDKSDIMDALKEHCFNEQLIDQPRIDALLNIFIVLGYSDIEFESRDMWDLLDLYDYMEVNNHIATIIKAIPEIEYNALIGYYESTVNDFNRFKTSALATFANIAEFGPELMEKISEISKEIDTDAIKLVADISTKMN